MFTPQPFVLDITQRCTDYKTCFDNVILTISYTGTGIFIKLNGYCVIEKNTKANVSAVFRFTNMFLSLENSFWRFTSSFGLFPEKFRAIVFREIYRIHMEKQSSVLGKVNKK